MVAETNTNSVADDMTQATLEKHDTDDSVTVNVFINDADEETSVASTSSLLKLLYKLYFMEGARCDYNTNDNIFSSSC